VNAVTAPIGSGSALGRKHDVRLQNRRNIVTNCARLVHRVVMHIVSILIGSVWSAWATTH
jgi:hypothetical protein